MTEKEKEKNEEERCAELSCRLRGEKNRKDRPFFQSPQDYLMLKGEEVKTDSCNVHPSFQIALRKDKGSEREPFYFLST